MIGKHRRPNKIRAVTWIMVILGAALFLILAPVWIYFQA